MSHVLIIYDKFDGCNQTDTKHMIERLLDCNKNHEITHKPEVQVNKNDIEWSDILILIRPTSIYALEVEKAARRLGIFVVVVFDDDLINIPRSPLYHHFHWRSRYAKKTIYFSNVLVCSNNLLASEYEHYMKKTRSVVLPTSVKFERKNIVSNVSNKKTLRVIYAASRDHANIFNEIIGPIIKPLFERYPETFDFTFLCVQPDVSLFPDNVTVNLVPGMDYEKFKVFLQNGNFDIGLAPLHDDPFSNRKGIVKFIDYSVAGILGVYSNCLPYTNVIRSEENGILVNNNPEDWFNVFSVLAENPEKIKNMVQTAQNDICEKFSPEKAAEYMLSKIPEFFSPPSKSDKKLYIFRNPFSHGLFLMRELWNEKLLTTKLIWPISEKILNISENIKEKGFVGAIAYYFRKPFKN